jgi:hypothetical protein
MGGVAWRVTMGRYGPGDLRLEWQMRGRWVPVQMVLGAIMADFYGDNEDALYPAGLGWQKYAQWIALAASQGWVPAQHQMLQEKAKRGRHG